MTPKTKKGLIAVLVVVIAAGAVIFFTQKGKKKYADIIIKAGKHNNYSIIITFDEDFLKAWAKAVQNQQVTFSYKSQNYNTQGGKKVIQVNTASNTDDSSPKVYGGLSDGGYWL